MKTESIGKKLVKELKTGNIKKDIPLEKGINFDKGYEQLYYWKFKTYLSSISRYLINDVYKLEGF